MGDRDIVRKLLESGVIAIIRSRSSDQLLAVADAIQAGGVVAIEVTMTTPNALRIIEKAAARYESGVLFGVGSVLDPESARAAILAGARFVVYPTMSAETIRLCNRYAVPVIPGAFTPNEILAAWEAGADLVKVFPADVGGPGYIKAVKAPLPQVRLVPVGGVNLDTAADFIRAGSDVVAVGSALVDQAMVDAGRFEEIRDRARRFCEEVTRGRAG
jgi:2-dehydro-3-deoxyphosphogluconate aldolase/(4S)-4-hydroxy-2-oxoglutarate aldolase